MAAHCGKVGLIMRTYYSSYVFLFFFLTTVFSEALYETFPLHSPSYYFLLLYLIYRQLYCHISSTLPKCFFVFSLDSMYVYTSLQPCICSLSTSHHQIHVNFCIIFTRSSRFPELALESYRFHDLTTQEKSPWVGVRQMRILFTGALANHRGNLEENNLDSSLQFSAKYGDKEQRLLHLSSPNKKKTTTACTNIRYLIIKRGHHFF